MPQSIGVTLRGNTHPLARAEFDRGRAPDSQPLRRMLLVLERGPEREAQLARLLEEQQNPSSPNYRHWLTSEEFGERFGPADGDVQAVTDWLGSEGFVIERVSRGRTVVEFSGTAGLVREALHTEMHQYRVEAEDHWANASDPQIPAALAPFIRGFVSLNNFPRRPLLHRLGTFRRNRSTGELRPLFTFPRSGVSKFALGPTDFATIYNVLPLWQAGIDGTGQTIAIVNDSNIKVQDVRDFRSMFGLAPNDPQIILDGPDPGILSGDAEGEADLDVEWSGAVAKGATIDLVIAESTETTHGTDLAALHIVDTNLAPVMSESFGACEASLGTGVNAFFAALWQQAAAQGITVIVSSGDSGSANCDGAPETAAASGLAVSGFASTPYNIAVGGTDFDDVGFESNFWNSTNASGSQASAKSYIPESTWNDSCAAAGLATGCPTVDSKGKDLEAGGGGPSSCASLTSTGTCAGYAKPSWQTGPGVPADKVRDIPDISLFASNGRNGSFYIFCQADANASNGGNPSSCDLNSPFQDFQGAGGTSFSAPAFAGIMAMVNQHLLQPTMLGSGRQGNANFVLYPLAAQNGNTCTSNAAAVSNTSCVFYDVIKGNISVACEAGSPNCSSAAMTPGILVNPANTSQPAWPTAAGYDLATGLGSVNAANLVNNWTAVGFTHTATTLGLAPTSILHGQPVTATVNVTSMSGTPTGAVSLLGGPSGGAIGAITLANGAASVPIDFFPGGSYNVTAHYGGDGTFSASDSTPVAITVSPQASATRIALVTLNASGMTVSSNATTAVYGSPYVFRVDVTAASGGDCSTHPIACPTGKVVVTDNGGPPPDQSPPASAVPGVFRLNSRGFLEDAFVQFPAGTHALVASYAGDSSFTASTSATDTITITTATTSTALSAPASVAPNASVTLTATVSTQSSGVAPTGTVQFLNAGAPIAGTVAYTPAAGSTTSTASLQATLSTSFMTDATLTAVYSSGDSNYSGSTTSAIRLKVEDFSISASPTSFTIAAAGEPGTSMITESALGSFSGTVNFTCSLPTAMKEASCSFNLASVTTSGTTTLTVSTTGPHTVGAVHRFPAPPSGLAPFAALLFALLAVATVSDRRFAAPFRGELHPPEAKRGRQNAGAPRDPSLHALDDPRISGAPVEASLDSGRGRRRNSSRPGRDGTAGAAARLKRQGLRYALLALFALAGLVMACGGGGGGSTTTTTDPGTPPGTYMVTVTASGGTITHSLNVTVTLQ